MTEDSEAMDTGCSCCDSCAEMPRHVTRRRFLSTGARVGMLAGIAATFQVLSNALGAAASTAVKKTAIVKTSAMKVGAAHAFQNPYTHQPAYLTQPTKGHFKAFSRICPHAGCTIGFNSKIFVCPCHGSEFNATTGAVVRGPARRALTPYSVVVGGGEVYIES